MNSCGPDQSSKLSLQPYLSKFYHGALHSTSSVGVIGVFFE